MYIFIYRYKPARVVKKKKRKKRRNRQVLFAKLSKQNTRINIIKSMFVYTAISKEEEKREQTILFIYTFKLITNTLDHHDKSTYHRR
jgi:hypothetical protein